MLKPPDLEAKLKIYEIYINRISKEGDFFWSRFKIYFGFNSGAFLILGFLIKPHIENAGLGKTPTSILLIGIFFSLMGIVITWVWYLIAKDGYKWQAEMNNVIAGIEAELFLNTSMGLYTTIIKVDSDNPKKDVVKIGMKTVLVFLGMWVSIMVVFICLLFSKW